MNNDLKKKIRSATAGILAVVIIVSGTFAWNAFDQEATNKTKGIPKGAGARLHDDFDGSNKDVYIENYGEEGGPLVYARIRLDEYMEIGTDAGVGGTNLEVLRGDKEKTAGSVPLVDDVTTWDTYLYGSTADGSEQIRKYRDLAFGGSTIYMPTFNKHIYNLDADINGTLEGLDGDILTDADAYSDYKTYSNGQSVTADGKYATDDQNDNDQRPNDYKTVTETHVAKPTLTSTVMSMEQWKTNGSKPGPYWVYDVDGWAYWAQGIEAQTATGLLLTGITVVEDPEEEWFYAVNVVSQMATAGDWGTEEGKDGFYEDGITEDGEDLLNQLTASIHLSTQGNVTEVSFEEPLQLTSKVVGLRDESVTWTVTGGTGTTAISNTGLLTVDQLQAGGSTLTVRVQSNVLPTLYKEKTIRVTPTFKNVKPGSDITVRAENIDWYVINHKFEGDKEAVLVLAKDIVENRQYNDKNESRWKNSTLRAYLNDTSSSGFIGGKIPSLADKILPATYNNSIGGSTSGNTELLTDSVFILAQDGYGWVPAQGIGPTSFPTDSSAHGYNRQNIGQNYWLRTPYTLEQIRSVSTGGYLNASNPTQVLGVRPAFWICI